MNTKDGRRAYGTKVSHCDCGRPATIGRGSLKICERCDKIQKKIFSDKNYCGELDKNYVDENLAMG